MAAGRAPPMGSARSSNPCCSIEDVAMRNFDFAPLWRSTVGFDRLFDLLNNTESSEIGDSYPPYDIVRTGEENYRIALALAGFSPDEVTITAQQNRLTVAGHKTEDAKYEFIYQSIARRPFERHFSLADFVEVEKAAFDNGLLQIDLVRRVPEAMKPRRIEINGATRDAPAKPGVRAA
jgi:molecular chaperone IbpA